MSKIQPNALNTIVRTDYTKGGKNTKVKWVLKSEMITTSAITHKIYFQSVKLIRDCELYIISLLIKSIANATTLNAMVVPRLSTFRRPIHDVSENGVYIERNKAENVRMKTTEPMR